MAVTSPDTAPDRGAPHIAPADTPAGSPSTGRSSDRWPTWVVVVALAVVPLAAVVVSVVASWRYAVTVGDTAWLTQRVADAASGRWPVVGMPSSIGRGEFATHHPGPLQFYWLAPWWALGGFRGIVVGTAASGALALGWLGALVRRLPRSSVPAAVGAQVAAVVGILTVGTELLADPWNPYAALPWAVLAVAATVAVILGVRPGWWALVVAGSAAAQFHVSFVPLVAVLVVAAGVAAVRRPSARPSLSTVGLLALLTLVLWIPPLVDLAVGDHNPVLLARATVSGSGPVAGVRPVVVAAAAALDPAHGVVDAPWLPTDPTGTEWLLVAAALTVAALTWWFGRRGHWARTWVATFGLTTVLWGLLATRALPFQGLLPVAYTRPLWPLGACLWFGIGAVWWERRPAPLARATWIPVVVMALWAATVPRGYVGIDPATRLRAAEVAGALATADLPERADVTARGFLGGWWIAPTVTAELDRRGVTNGVGTNRDWDIAVMTDRSRPLPGNDCELVVGDVAPSGPVLAPARGLSASDRTRLGRLEEELVARFPTIGPSRVARELAARTGTPALPDAPVADLIRDGRWADLVVTGSIDGVSLRDDRVREYVELAHRAAPSWAGLSVWSRGC